MNKNTALSAKTERGTHTFTFRNKGHEKFYITERQLESVVRKVAFDGTGGREC